jgi:uncharacterized protein
MPIEVRKPTQEEIESTRNWPTWTKEVSEFPWSYEEKETCFILTGSAEVEGKDGSKATFSAGDWVVFPKGLECTWRIFDSIEKKYKLGE